MRRYLVETFLEPDTPGECTAREWRVRSAAGELRRRGIRVRFDRAIRVPEDGLCVFVFEAASGREATLTAQLAQLNPFRVVEVVRPKRGSVAG